MAFFARGTMKPPLGALVNPEHPLGRDFRFGVLLNEGFGIPTTQYANLGTSAATVLVVGTPGWNSNARGIAYQCPSVNDYLRFGVDVMPTSAVTVCVVRRKLDTTLRASGLFGQLAATTTAKRCGASVPKADGTVNWYFGGSTAPNLVTASGLSFTTDVEDWVFTAGPQGSSIWQNGVKVASQATAITRTAGGNNTCLNRGIESGSSTGDIQEINFFQVVGQQWSDDLCRWWSAEPYVQLYPHPTRRRYFLLGDRVLIAGHPTHYYAQQRGQAT
jgi:hypothetical protein